MELHADTCMCTAYVISNDIPLHRDKRADRFGQAYIISPSHQQRGHNGLEAGLDLGLGPALRLRRVLHRLWQVSGLHESAVALQFTSAASTGTRFCFKRFEDMFRSALGPSTQNSSGASTCQEPFVAGCAPSTAASRRRVVTASASS